MAMESLIGDVEDWEKNRVSDKQVNYIGSDNTYKITVRKKVNGKYHISLSKWDATPGKFNSNFGEAYGKQEEVDTLDEVHPIISEWMIEYS